MLLFSGDNQSKNCFCSYTIQSLNLPWLDKISSQREATAGKSLNGDLSVNLKSYSVLGHGSGDQMGSLEKQT
jgi:hypothetical protein